MIPVDVAFYQEEEQLKCHFLLFAWLLGPE